MLISPIKQSIGFKGYIYGKDINNKKVGVDTDDIRSIEKFGASAVVTKNDDTEILYKAPFPIVITAFEMAGKSDNTNINIDKFDMKEYWNIRKDKK